MSTFTNFKKFVRKASDKAMTDVLKLAFLLFVMALLTVYGVHIGAAILVIIAVMAIIACVFGLAVVLYDEVRRVRAIPEKEVLHDGLGTKTATNGSK